MKKQMHKLIESCLSNENLNLIISIINYWGNAASSNILEKKININKVRANSLIDKVNLIKSERDFFSNWGIYENDIPTDLSSQEITLIIRILKLTLYFFRSKDVDILALFDEAELIDLDNKLNRSI